ncbi:extracellular solute-binding protein [Permianibacter sp. IMCC34836]|uniref:ABC transporter substrate-binding protein n=1 Tax=Permianibacter fluminis TaxID=2738515 RepID=UPI0015532157|nr:extracellular solute-binding protein [Permianibacter fluminis]NQD36540.1 extracellular solute-binding protein [Permianibacter fluminis]
MQRRTVLKAGLLGLTLPAGLRAAESLRVAVFPEYNVADVLREFTARHGIAVTLLTYDSNEDLLAACIKGERFDVVTLSHYMLPHYHALGLLQNLPTTASEVAQPRHWNNRFGGLGELAGRQLALPKNYGTTGFIYRRSHFPLLRDWPEFWAAVMQLPGKRASVLDDVQSVVGAALCNFGFSYNSTKPSQLLAADQLLSQCAPHIREIQVVAEDAIRRGDWLFMSYSDGGWANTRSDPDVVYAIPQRGGELWCDLYAVSASCQQPEQAGLLLSWLLQPEQIAQEVMQLGVSPVDNRVLPLLPTTLRQDPIIFPSAELLAKLEFSSQEALREPLRAEIFAKLAARL